jgi:hypothetical protein
LRQTEHAQFLEDNSPGKHEGNFKIEQDKQDGNQIIADIELHARIFERFKAALVGRQLGSIRTMRPDHQPHDKRTNADKQSDDKEQQNRKVVLQHSPIPLY